MTTILSPNTKAILLLTAPLILGRNAAPPDLLTLGEYNRLAGQLHEINRQPADLLSPSTVELLRTQRPEIDENSLQRLQRLLGRGFLLSQVIEHWQSRAIWVISRADADYPARLKERLRPEHRPPVLYGCGELNLLETGGLAVVGSRDVDIELVNYTVSVAGSAARAGKTVVSGGARGIDQAAMRGALEAGGKVIGVLADSLERTTMSREHRNFLLDGRLTLISPYDPSAGFNVGNAMQRNKLIYALADASLVVSSDINKGGTWAGATEQLNRLQSGPMFVRQTGTPSEGLDALRKRGALPWPDPQDRNSFDKAFNSTLLDHATVPQDGLPLFANDGPLDMLPVSTSLPENLTESNASGESGPTADSELMAQPIEQGPDPLESGTQEFRNEPEVTGLAPKTVSSPADILFATVREILRLLLKIPKKDTEIAEELGVTNSQAKAWLQRLVDEGIIEKQKKPACYVIKKETSAQQPALFDQAMLRL